MVWTQQAVRHDRSRTWDNPAIWRTKSSVSGSMSAAWRVGAAPPRRIGRTCKASMGQCTTSDRARLRRGFPAKTGRSGEGTAYEISCGEENGSIKLDASKNLSWSGSGDHDSMMVVRDGGVGC